MSQISQYYIYMELDIDNKKNKLLNYESNLIYLILLLFLMCDYFQPNFNRLLAHEYFTNILCFLIYIYIYTKSKDWSTFNFYDHQKK